MTPPPTRPAPTPPDRRVLCVCRDPASRAAVQQNLNRCQVCSSAAEALLQAARVPPRAVVIGIENGGTSTRQVLAALARSLPAVPVYAVVPPENEPLAARLLAEGLADYFVLPNDVRRLPEVLAGRADPTAGASPAVGPDAERLARRFDAACRLAGLALSQPTPLFYDGARLIFQALGAAEACAFWWSAQAGRLDLAVIVGGSESLGADDRETVRSAASRSLRTGETLLLAPGSAGAPPDGLVCVPVRDESAIHGVLCLPARSKGQALSAEDQRAAEALANALAHLVAAARRREEYARLALRDTETGLLQADPFLTYLESQIACARDRQTDVALVLVETEPGPQARTADGPARLGAAVKEALARGWEGGRLSTCRYAVAITAPQGSEGSPAAAQTAEAAARRLAAAGPRAEPTMRLRTAIARFPQDGPTAQALVAAAEQRLRPAPDPAT